MRATGQEGDAVVRVKVNARGEPDSSSMAFMFVTSDHFEYAVRASVPHMRFAPRTSDGAILVELANEFRLVR